MGWSSGSDILAGVWQIVRPKINSGERVEVLTALMNLFEDHDCDTVEELVNNTEWAEAGSALDSRKSV